MSQSACYRLLVRAQPGTRRAVAAHIRRAEHLVELVESRYGIGSPWQWRVHQLRWALEVGLRDLAPATRYHYYRTARACAAALGHWPDWQPHLRGPWCSPSGETPARTSRGRPPKLAHRARAKQKLHRTVSRD